MCEKTFRNFHAGSGQIPIVFFGFFCEQCYAVVSNGISYLQIDQSINWLVLTVEIYSHLRGDTDPSSRSQDTQVS